MTTDELVDRAVRLLRPLLPTAAQAGGASGEWVAAHRLFEAVARPLRRLDEDDLLEVFIADPYADTDVPDLLVRSLTENPEFLPELMAAVNGAPSEAVASPLFDEVELGVEGTRFEIALRAVLMPAEHVLRFSRIVVGIREGLIALTNQRVIIISAGPVRWSAPRPTAKIRLEHIKDVSCVGGGFMDSGQYTLTIESRTGRFDARFFGRTGRQEGPLWPGFILEAQRAIVTVRPAAGRDIASALSELANLHAAGALTDTEFAEAKRRLIGM